MHLWNDSSEGRVISTGSPLRTIDKESRAEQSRVWNILGVGSPLTASLDMGMLGAWQGGDRHPNIGPAVNLILRRWLHILFERGCRFKRLWMRRMDAIFGCQGYWAEEGGSEAKLFKGDCLASSQLPLCVCFMNSMKLDWFTTLCSQTTKSR